MVDLSLNLPHLLSIMLVDWTAVRAGSSQPRGCQPRDTPSIAAITSTLWLTDVYHRSRTSLPRFAFRVAANIAVCRKEKAPDPELASILNEDELSVLAMEHLLRS